MLREVRRDDAVAELDAALVRLALPEERLEERRLPRPVRADERDVLAALEHERRAVEEQLVARRDDEPFRVEDDPSRSRWLQELEAERAAALRHRLELLRCRTALLLEPADLAELRLRLLRLGLLVAEPRHEPLETLDVVADTVELRRRRRRAGRLLTAPCMPRAVEEERLRPAELEHGGRHRLEEPAVVRDEDHGRVERRQLALEPLEALDVEVVRRLVEQQQVGVGREGASEGGAGQLPARERVELPVEVVVREPEAPDDRRCSIAPGPAAGVLEPCLRLAVAPERRLPVVAAGHRLLEPPELVLDRDEIAGARERVLPEREPLAPRGALVVERDPRVLRERELAALQRGLARDRAQEGRLPGAVGPGEREAIATAQPERDPVEEGVAGELLAQPGGDQDGHGLKGADECAAACGDGSHARSRPRPGEASSASPPTGRRVVFAAWPRPTPPA